VKISEKFFSFIVKLNIFSKNVLTTGKKMLEKNFAVILQCHEDRRNFRVRQAADKGGVFPI
jgi:hypothetical protein